MGLQNCMKCPHKKIKTSQHSLNFSFMANGELFVDLLKFLNLDHIQQNLWPGLSHFKTNLGWTVAWHSNQRSLVVSIEFCLEFGGSFE